MAPTTSPLGPDEHLVIARHFRPHLLNVACLALNYTIEENKEFITIKARGAGAYRLSFQIDYVRVDPQTLPDTPSQRVAELSEQRIPLAEKVYQRAYDQRSDTSAPIHPHVTSLLTSVTQETTHA